ncbi:hypothetical protein ACFB49_30320 [Sphingomonas sp. DBB INV C78]|uniref:hypothetical protein n=1 Tax=Sphingomonas sp. DBB INV C78 TaxID=3349434 RepID=UPI0036D434FA
MSSQFARRTVIAAIDVFESQWYQADFTAFVTELGPTIYQQIRDVPVSLKNRLSDLKRYIDMNPGTIVDGTPLEQLVVERAVSLFPAPRQSIFSTPAPLLPILEQFKRVLELDGFTITEGALRRILPADIGLPETESELMRLFAAHGLTTAKGHLEQAMDAHARGNWAGANAQIRTFLDALLDELAARVDPTAQTVSTGQPRRAKLAASGFLSVPLNEWADDGKGFLNGLTKRLHPQGSHPGLSDEDDSTFRLHVVLLTATLLLKRFDRGSNYVARS